jgi:DNA repair protein RadA/Sms
MTNVKNHTFFECSNCGAQYPKWEGRCRGCGKWSTIAESTNNVEACQTSAQQKIDPAQIVDFSKINAKTQPRISTYIKEFDRVLGGGIVPGSAVLIGGAPGIGKSTLLLQLINKTGGLYISGEESATQVKLRFDRLKLKANDVQFSNETITEKICAAINQTKSKLTIVDSIQTLRSSESGSVAGSQNQVTVSCAKLMGAAKKTNVPIFLIGHITKQGIVAGPKTLEHLVDTVLYLEGDKNHCYRLLRSAKNRFGSVDEVGIFEMTNLGMQEVKNPSQAFLQDLDTRTPGTVTTVIVEGSRPLLVEIQALTTKTYFGYPRRACSGFKKSRLELLIAILTKRLKLPLGQFDVYLNVAGGLKISEPAADLAAALAITSSFRDQALDARTCAFGELGLGGEVRPVPFFEKRLREAENLGFKQVICPKLKNRVKTVLEIKEIKNIKYKTRDLGN